MYTNANYPEALKHLCNSCMLGISCNDTTRLISLRYHVQLLQHTVIIVHVLLHAELLQLTVIVTHPGLGWWYMCTC